MAKITFDDIKDMGFNKEMFLKNDEAELTIFIDKVIAEQATLLSGRIGSAAYASAIIPLVTFVTRAEKLLVSAELTQIRINLILQRIIIDKDNPDTKALHTQRDAYKADAKLYIQKAIDGTITDSKGFSSSVVIS